MEPARTPTRQRLAAIAAVIALAVVFFFGLGRPPLFEPDEGRYAEIPREMLARGDFVTPTLDGVLYFEKPPLYYWLNATSIALLGRSETAVRLPGALFGFLATGLAWGLARAMGGARSGPAAAMLVGAAPLSIVLGRLATIDTTLSFLIAACLACFWIAHEREPGPRTRRLWWGAFAASALAVMTKGLVGLLIPGAVVFLYLLLTRQWRVLRAVPWGSGLAIFALLAVPWHLAMALRHPDFLWFYFVHEHLLRYTTDSAQRDEPFWYFATVLAGGLLPWSGLVLTATLAGRRSGSPRERRAQLFLLLWAGFVFVFFSASRSKLAPYVLPAVLPLGVLTDLALGRALVGERWLRRALAWAGAAGALALALVVALLGAASFGLVARFTPRMPAPVAIVPLAVAGTLAALGAAWLWLRWRPVRAIGVATAGVVGLIVCALLAVPVLGRTRSSRTIAEFLAPRLAEGADVVGFEAYPQGLPFYLARTIDLVDFVGELDFGIRHLGSREREDGFPTLAELRARWGGPERIYLVTERGKLDALRRTGLELGAVELWEGNYLLFANPKARDGAP